MLNYDLKNTTLEKGLNQQEDIYGLLFIRKNLRIKIKQCLMNINLKKIKKKD